MTIQELRTRQQWTLPQKIDHSLGVIEQFSNHFDGHTEGTPVVENRNEPTCTVAGSYQNVVYCSVEGCGVEISRDTVEIPANGHDTVGHEAKAPTCTEIGWDTYQTCKNCAYTTYVEKAALGHDKESHEAKAPTCTAIGWDAYVTCSRCDYTTYNELAALGHTPVTDEAVDPTCTETGLKQGSHCGVCPSSYG